MTPSRRVQLSIHVGLAFLGVLPTLLVPGSTVGDGVDAFGTHWFYWWIKVCVEHFGNPSHTPLFFYPFGKDIFADTGNNFVDALFSVPFQWVFGPTLYQPLFIVFLQLGNVVAFRPLARYVLGDGFSAFAATLLWQINPFVLFEITAGRPTQAMAWYLPVAVFYFLKTAREPGWKNPAWLGVAVAVSGWTYWFTAYFLVILLLPLAAWEWRESKDRKGFLLRLAFAVALCLLIAAPGLVGMMHAIGQKRVPGIDPTKGSIFEAPTPIGNNVSADLHGIWLMEFYGSPLFFEQAWGIPLLVAPWWKKLAMPGGKARWLFAIAWVIAFAGGTMFRVGEHTVVMPQYMLLYRHLPFFDRLWFPYRLAVVAFIPASLIVGAMVGVVSRPRLALGALVVLGLGGQVVTGSWPFNHRYSRAPALVASLKNEGGGVIFLPMKIQHDGLMWQTEFQLPTFGGMGESAPIFWPEEWRRRLNNSLIKSLRGAAIDPSMERRVVKRDRESLEKEGFRWVILRRSLLESEMRRLLDEEHQTFDKHARMQQTIDAITDLLGAGPVGVGGDAVVWDLQGRYVAPPAWAATPENLANEGWEEIGMPEYEEKLRAIGRTGGVRERTQPNLPH